MEKVSGDNGLLGNYIFSQSIFDNSPAAIIIYKVMGDGSSGNDYIIKNINHSCAKIEGWKKEDVIGKALSAVRPGVEEFGIIDIFKNVYETGEATHYPANVYMENEENRWFENTIFRLPSGEIVAVYEDVTEEKLAEEALFREKEKLKVTLYSICDGVITTDNQGRIEMMNQVAENLTGWKQDAAQGRPLSEVYDIRSEKTIKSCRNAVGAVLKSGKPTDFSNHLILVSSGGTERFISDSAAPIKDKNGEMLGAILVFRDVTTEKEKELKIEYLSYRDSLTGLYNRAYLEAELAKPDVENQLPLTFIMGDLDGLKLINDAFGHQEGDEALIKIAEVFKLSCRETDVISRWGGDEFVIMLPNTPATVGQKVCDRINEGCSDVKIAGMKVSISLGCATRDDIEEEWVETLKRAEDKMYKSKLLGAQSYRSIVLQSIKNALFDKGCETEEHGERLGEFCKAIGKSMDLTPFEIDELKVLAMLHDIGKIAIDDRILKKPNKLTDDEMQIIKKHPEIGYRIAQTVPELQNIANYILAHHERWDGEGYPRGLSEEEIPLLSRILAITDAYDAMTQGRPYRDAMPVDHAREELRMNAGTQFDPFITEIFIRCLTRDNDNN